MRDFRRAPDALRASLVDFPCFQLYLGWRRAQAYYRPYLGADLNPQRMYVLTLLVEHGELCVSELAAALDVELGSISGLLTRMEREELVERRRGAEDKKQVLVRPTRRGRARHRRFAALLEEADVPLLDELDDRDLRGVHRLVDVLGRLTTDPDETR